MKKVLVLDSSHIYAKYLYSYLSDICEVSVITKPKQINQFDGETFDFFYFILHEPLEIVSLLAIQNSITIKSLVLCSSPSMELKAKLKEFSRFYYIDLSKPKHELLFSIKVLIKSHV